MNQEVKEVVEEVVEEVKVEEVTPSVPTPQDATTVQPEQTGFDFEVAFNGLSQTATLEEVIYKVNRVLVVFNEMRIKFVNVKPEVMKNLEAYLAEDIRIISKVK
jgi:hypothetical protein